MNVPLRRTNTPFLLLLAVLLAIPTFGVGCRRQDQIGAITQYTRGGQNGPNGSNSGVGGGGKTGVVTLKALFTGALLINGSPELGQLVPENGESAALPTTPIVAIFSESIDPASVTSSSFVLSQSGSGTGFDVPIPVPSVLGVDLATDGRVAVLLPTQPLDIATQYSIQLNGIEDLEGNPVQGTTSDEPAGPFGGVGGGASATQSFQSYNPGAFAAPRFGVIAMYPPPGDKAAKRDTLVRLFFNAPVDEPSVTDGGVTVMIGTSVVPGELQVLGDPRIVQFVPDDLLPLGADVTVRVETTVMSGPIPGLFPNGLPLAGGAFSETFQVNSVPTPSSIKLPGNAPVQFGGVTFAGSLTQANLHDFKADVKVPNTSPGAESTVLLFFQPKGAAEPPGRAFTKEKGSGTVSFGVDLGKGGDSAAFADSDQTFPPRPLIIGAFAQRGNLRSPVGPLTLPQVFVKTSEPDVVLGPPSEDDAPYVFRTVLGRPGVYGTASEPITAFRLVVNGASIPSTLDAISLGGPGFVTDDAGFFVTTPPAASLPGAEIGAGPHFLPLQIDELSVTDVVGNQRVVQAPDVGSIYYEGSIGGPLEATAMEHLRVRVVAADTLMPVKNAEVRLDEFPFSVGNTPMIKKTGKGGEAIFSDTSALGASLLITASKSKYEAFTLAGFDNPAVTGAMGISIVLQRTDVSRLEVKVATTEDIPDIGTPGVAFVASAAGSGRPASGKNPTDPDSRFFVAALKQNTETFLRVEPARPFIVSNFEHDGQDIYALQQSSVLARTEDLTVGFGYAEKGGTMDFAQSFANTVVQTADVTAAGITEDPYGITVGRLVGTLPGLPDVFPVSFSPTPLGAPGATRTLFAPIPPSLWVNEAAPIVDPAYELLFQPAAGTGFLPPTEGELEGTFRFEIEAAEVSSTRLTRHRAPLDFIAPTEAKTIGAIRFPRVPLVQQEVGTNHPLSIQFDTTLAGADFDDARSLLRITLRRPSDSGKWVVLLAATAGGIAPGAFAFPDLALDPYDQPGMFEVEVEAIEMPVGFDFDGFMLSDVERDHERLSQSATMTFDTTP